MRVVRRTTRKVETVSVDDLVGRGSIYHYGELEQLREEVRHLRYMIVRLLEYGRFTNEQILRIVDRDHMYKAVDERN